MKNKNANSYDNQTMKSIVDILSKKQSYNVAKDNEDTVNNNSKEVGFSNSADGSNIIQEDDKESDEEIGKYVVENNVVGNQRGTKLIAKLHQLPKAYIRIRYK